MNKTVQKRTLATRAKLLEVAKKSVVLNGYSALRVEQVVQDAGVAKGTFFAHFRDKDALMDIIIGANIDALLDDLDALPLPNTLAVFIENISPFMQFMASERYVFDLILRHSGAAAKQEIGPIACTFDRHIELLAKWLADGPFRKDVPADILAQGTQAFMVQCIAWNFCAINCEDPMETRLLTFLNAWLCPHIPKV